MLKQVQHDNRMISIIAAIGKNRELGKDNKLLFKIPEDMKRFKELTKGHPIIMGRKTWDSLPFKPLPNRTNIVVTRSSSFDFASLRLRGSDSRRRGLAKLAGSLEEALRLASLSQGNDEIFIIGGGQVYKEAIEKNLVDKLYLTVVDASADADTFFPDYSAFKTIISEENRESDGYKYKFLELEK